MYKNSVFLGALIFLSGVQHVGAAAVGEAIPNPPTCLIEEATQLPYGLSHIVALYTYSHPLQLRHRLIGHTSPVCSLLYRKGAEKCSGKKPDFLISGLQDGKIVVWNLETKELVREFPAHKGAVTHLTHLDGGGFASSGADCFVKTWNFRSGKCWSERQLAAPAAGIVGWPNGELLIAEDTGKYALHFIYDDGMPEEDHALWEVERDMRPLFNEEPSLRQNLGLVCKLMEDKQRAVKRQCHLSLRLCREDLKALRPDDYAQGVMFAPKNVLARDAQSKRVRWYSRETWAEHPHKLLQEIPGYENDALPMEIGSESCLFLASPAHEIHVWAEDDEQKS